jgi:DNA processing protein
MDADSLHTLMRLLLVPGMGSAAASRLLRVYGGDPGRVLAAPREDLARVKGVGPALADAVAAAPGTPEEAHREIARARDGAALLLGPADDGYPVPLLSTFDPPPLLWIRGAWVPGDTVSVAVVGARRATPYGLIHGGRMGRGLATRGVTVVSGLARGVDTAAHRGALEVAGGRTLAVVGSGLAKPYPAENLPLLRDIARNGAVISEFPLDTPPLPHHFPRRNRILAGLALGTVVVEAGEKSGSLITAYLALDAGRDVMALPGNVDAPGSKGVHRLLREGAALIEGPDCVLEVLGLSSEGGDGEVLAPELPEGPPATVFEALEGGQVLDADELVGVTGLSAGEVRAALATLEVDGRVRSFSGGRYAR